MRGMHKFITGIHEATFTQMPAACCQLPAACCLVPSACCLGPVGLANMLASMWWPGCERGFLYMHIYIVCVCVGVFAFWCLGFGAKKCFAQRQCQQQPAKNYWKFSIFLFFLHSFLYFFILNCSVACTACKAKDGQEQTDCSLAAPSHMQRWLRLFGFLEVALIAAQSEILSEICSSWEGKGQKTKWKNNPWC